MVFVGVHPCRVLTCVQHGEARPAGRSLDKCGRCGREKNVGLEPSKEPEKLPGTG